ncbi:MULTISPECIES: hypothetical protein [Paenibacillus]|uniref:hypothetical protein n=1 Tax=Paenibacillus TaxID=44249 RepID=UPI0015C3233E|nr:hypothetical protein [Paenibacillus odorifer]
MERSAYFFDVNALLELYTELSYQNRTIAVLDEIGVRVASDRFHIAELVIV